MRKLISIFSLLFLYNFQAFSGLDDYKLGFRSVNYYPEENSSFKEALSPDKEEIINNRYFRIIQFFEIPTEEEKEDLRSQGVKFVFYQPRNAYYVSLPSDLKSNELEGKGIRAILKLDPSWKISERILSGTIPDHAKSSQGYMASVSYAPGLNKETLDREMNALGFEPEYSLDFTTSFDVEIKRAKDLEKVVNSPVTYFVDFSDDPGAPENNTARTLHRSNAIHPDYGAGKEYNGEGVTLQIQDNSSMDGAGSHIDWQGRTNTSNSQGLTQTHGAHVAGTVMGAGNLNPLAEGMASGAFVYKFGPGNGNYGAVPGLVVSQDMVMTQKSYSNGCNAGYTSLTQALDSMVNGFPQLLHVFSAGNSNGSNCGYGAGNQWGNVTGGHKIAKNAIATANVSATGTISGSSSRGPAWDGRIKPDISAKGSQVFSTYPGNVYATISGTSMASPGVAGVAAQLYQAFRDQNAGANPQGGLIKAIMLNTANELGNQGPDFTYGWGHVNGYKAVKVIENSQFLVDTISQNDSLVYTITVPANTKELRLMVYWPDKYGAVNANPSLVNDLDFSVFGPTNIRYLPWVLDHTPNASTLNNPAFRGADHLNNMEQVTIDNPMAGTYTMVVKGYSIPSGPQEFFITNLVEDDNIKLTYPIGRESIEPGENVIIRWDAPPGSGTFALEYSLDSGSTWSTISAVVPASRRYWSWTVPNTPSPYALVRVTAGAKQSVSELPFYIMDPPSNVNISAVCPDSVQLSWSATPNAFGYVVRQLGAKYMDSVGFTAGTNFWFDIPSTSNSDWLTVNAVAIGDVKSRRAVAVKTTAGVFNCPEPPQADFTANQVNVCVGKPIQFYDESLNQTSSWSWSVSPNTVQFVNGTSNTSQNPEIVFNAMGNYDVTLDAGNANGIGSITKTSYIITIEGDTDPLFQRFQSNPFPPQNWEIENPNNNHTWDRSPNVVTYDGSTSTTAWISMFPHLVSGQEDQMKTLIMDLSGFIQPMLVFDISNAEKSEFISPTLYVDISTDCGVTFQNTGYAKSGSDLATVPGAVNSPWIPSDLSQWRSDTIDLSTWSSSSEVQIMYRVVAAALSNNIYLDRIRVIEGAANSLEGFVQDQEFLLYPNPAKNEVFVQIDANRKINGLEILDVNGRKVLDENSISFNGNSVRVNTASLKAGLYFVKVFTGSTVLVRKLEIE